MAKETKTIDGIEVEFEIDEKFEAHNEHGVASVFHVTKMNGSEQDTWHVCVGNKVSEKPDSPLNTEKTHVVCVCLEHTDALLVASSINIAYTVTNTEKAGVGLSELKRISGEIAERNGWDIKKAEAKMDELIAQGKSKDEVLAYMKEHISDFRKPDAPKVDAPKSAEEW